MAFSDICRSCRLLQSPNIHFEIIHGITDVLNTGYDRPSKRVQLRGTAQLNARYSLRKFFFFATHGFSPSILSSAFPSRPPSFATTHSLDVEDNFYFMDGSLVYSFQVPGLNGFGG